MSLYNFLGTTNGSNPYGGLTLIGSTFYGTCREGGSASNGLVFSINSDGTDFTVLKNFASADGSFCNTMITDGSILYGTAYGSGANGNGTVFKINPDGTGYNLMYSFGLDTDGMNPYAALLLIGSTLYGTTTNGGTNGTGTIFKINTDGTGYSVIYSFGTGTDGQNPQSSVINVSGVLYGTCTAGGGYGGGTIFQINTDGTSYSTVYNFGNSNDSYYPASALTLSGTTLYGTASGGGSASGFSGFGTVYKIDTDGSDYSILYSFETLPDGQNPASTLVLVDGVLYGTTYSGGTSNYAGTIFSINIDGSDYQTLYSFTGSPDGSSPNGSLVLDGTTIYGTTYSGGTNADFSYGTIFSYVTASITTVNPSTLDLGLTLYSPSSNISSTVSLSTLDLSLTLHTPTPLINGQVLFPSTLDLGLTLYQPSFTSSSSISPSTLNLDLILNNPTVSSGQNRINNASAILSFNPLVIVSNTNPVKVSFVNVSSPDAPIYTTYTYSGCSNATSVVYNSYTGMIYVACADGIILEINASTPTSYTINTTDALGNLTSLVVLPIFFEVYGGTDYSSGEIIDMYEGSLSTFGCDIRTNAIIQNTFGTFVNTVNAFTFGTDIRVLGVFNNIIGCDVRCISSSFADLSITPIARTDFVVYIGGVEVPDVKLDSIEITHTADQKSQATFILARKHDNVNYVLNPDGSQGTSIPVLGHPTVQITIQGNEEFGYDTPAYIWDVDCKSENEQVRITAYSELPKTENTQTVTLSIPLLNQQLHIYHVLINNPVIDDPVILPDDIQPPFYLGILIDNGYTRIQNVAQYQGFGTAGQTEDQFVNYVFGTDDGSGNPTGINQLIPPPPGSSSVVSTSVPVYFKPMQNWTYFWFGHATNFITGDTWEGLLNNGSSYLGTSPSSLTTTTWDVDYINFWYQREFPDTVYRGTIDGQGLATVYPSDFLGIVPFPYSPDPYDKVVGIDPFNGATTIDEVLRDHTPMTFTGADILAIKAKLAVLNIPGSYILVGYPQFSAYPITYLVTAEGALIPIPLNFSTKILDLVDSKFGVTFGSAPYKKVSCKSGVYNTATKWEDAPNGLFYHRAQGYNYTNYVDIVGEIELTKIQNINGSVLPKTKCDIEQFIDGYYYYNIQLLKRINIDQTIQPNIYNTNNGFPVSVKSIHISSKDMKVTLECTNAWSRLELLEIEGQIPDSYYYLILEQIIEYSPKFDPNTLQNIS